MSPTLVTGASGTVGGAVVRALRDARVPVRVAQRDATSGTDAVRFDFTDPRSWEPAFTGVESMFLMRPPALGNVRRDLLPAVAAARDCGVRRVVFLSLQGAERNRVVPHAAVEAWLRTSGMAWTFVRPSFFGQNLSTTHLSDIRDLDQIVVPAGRGATAFVDAEDVAAVAAAALLNPERHREREWTVTGPRALTYHQVAEILTDELARPIRYTAPGLPGYVRHARRRLGMPWGMVAVTAAIYTMARLGLAAGLTDDVKPSWAVTRSTSPPSPIASAAPGRRRRHPNRRTDGSGRDRCDRTDRSPARRSRFGTRSSPEPAGSRPRPAESRDHPPDTGGDR